MIVKFLKIHKDAVIPEYKTTESAGMDLHCIEDFVINPNEILLISTGLKMSIPKGFEGQIRPRSGLSLKGITIVNSPGTIDSDYRGEIKVILTNLSKIPVIFKKGDRIAQLIISPVVQANIVEEFNYLDETERGEGGFGSTGK